MKTRRFLTGFATATAIAAVAKRAHSLDMSGALAAAAVGTCVYGGLGLRGTVVMLGFFVPSSALSKVARRYTGANELVGKNGPRDAKQVLANGGLAALAALFGNRAWAKRAFAAALAAASSDTWSTEIGTAFGGTPNGLLSGTPAENGLSGNVSDAGFIGALAGAAWIAALSGCCGLARPRTVAVAGVGGGLADSLLGATLQSLSCCTVCGKFCETQSHCRQYTKHIRGWKFMNNDVVNALAVLAAIGIAEVIEAR